MNKYILRTRNLTKSFGKTEILHGIDLSIEYGEAYGLIGQNGAGKTTLLRLISGLMKPTKGTVNLQTGKTFIGYMPQSCRFDDNTTVSDTIRFFARLRDADVKESILLGEKLKLDMSKKVKYLSPGQQKKLQMIIAMTGEPDLYILDEPTAGLDPNATLEMKGIIKGIHEKGKSIIISSHILQDMDEICTNIAIMQNGVLTYNNEIETCYVFKIAEISPQVLDMLSNDFYLSVDELGTTLTAKITKEQVPQLISSLTTHSISIFEVTASNVKRIVQEHLHLIVSNDL
ncbi:MAG: ABC transporter ATP-binding protein [Clostridiales bacterium]|nr:ABC transporter ATP-binding protein [Clostridiales bacterium]